MESCVVYVSGGPWKMRKYEATQAQGRNAVASRSSKTGQKRPNAPAKSDETLRAQINERQTDNEAAIGHDRLAGLDKRRQAGFRFGNPAGAKRRMHFGSDEG